MRLDEVNIDTHIPLATDFLKDACYDTHDVHS